MHKSNTWIYNLLATMTAGKNKRVTKWRKGSRKKATDPLAKKEWFELRTPSMFTRRNIGRTCVNKTGGGKIASDVIKARDRGCPRKERIHQLPWYVIHSRCALHAHPQMAIARGRTCRCKIH